MGRIVILVTLETAILLAAVGAFAVGAKLGGLALLALALITPLVSWATSRPSRPPLHSGEIRTVPREKLDQTKVNMGKPPSQSVPHMPTPLPAEQQRPVEPEVTQPPASEIEAPSQPAPAPVPEPVIEVEDQVAAVEEEPVGEDAPVIADAADDDEAAPVFDGTAEEPAEAPIDAEYATEGGSDDFGVQEEAAAGEAEAPSEVEFAAEADAGEFEADRKAASEPPELVVDESEPEEAEPGESALSDFGPGGGFETGLASDELEAAHSEEELATEVTEEHFESSEAIDVPEEETERPEMARGITLPDAPVVVGGADEALASEADLTVFAPSAAGHGREFLIQLYLHAPDALEQVQALARLTDTGAAARPTMTLGEAIPHGAQVELRVDAPSLHVDEPIHTLIWRGQAAVAHVIARVPDDHAGGPAHVRVRTLIDGVPIRSAVFSVNVDAVEAIADDGDLVSVGSKRYRTAFLSYASEDRAKVLEHYQALSALGMEVFQDVLDLDPGERWEKALYTRIADSDVFLLYWSEAAAQSQWVTQEAEWALKSQPFDPDGRPDIIPVILEGPPPAAPPEALQHLQFNDPVRTIISAYANVEA